jgi:hypothetical protein
MTPALRRRFQVVEKASLPCLPRSDLRKETKAIRIVGSQFLLAHAQCLLSAFQNLHESHRSPVIPFAVICKCAG